MPQPDPAAPPSVPFAPHDPVAASAGALAAATETALIASDGTPLFARRFDPPAGRTVRGTVLFSPGIQSHGGWYGWSCAFLARHGWRVIFADRRGAGRNGTMRGDARHADRLLTDVRQFVRHARALSPGLPVVLAGISWGGKPATVAAAEPGLCDGLALLYPGLRARVRVGPVRSAAVRAAAALGRGRAPVRVPLDDPRLFAGDRRFREFVAADPLATRFVSVRFLKASLDLDRRLRPALARLSVPTLCVLAGADEVIDNAATRRLLGTCGSADVTVREVPGARHTLEFEPDRAEIFAGVRDWLDGAVGGGGGLN